MSRREGRRRFSLVFGAAAGGLCAATTAVILVAVCAAPYFMVRLLEWVLDGYREE